MSTTNLSNGKVVLSLRSVQETALLSGQLQQFLKPYFLKVDELRIADLGLSLLPLSAMPDGFLNVCTEPVSIRKSSAVAFNLDAIQGMADDGRLHVWDQVRAVGYRIDADCRIVEFFGGDAGFIHLVELLRYYSLLVEQARGTMVLHSAAVSCVGSDEVHAIVGRKGAGKTTTMLSMVATGRYRYFSGDKLLVDVVAGTLRVRGWPDYPHIGLGTLRQHPDLIRHMQVPLVGDDGGELPDTHKVLIDPEVFHAHVPAGHVEDARLTRIILPNVSEDAHPGVRMLSRDEKSALGTDELLEWPHMFATANWHGMAPTGLSRAREIPASFLNALLDLPWELIAGKQSQTTFASC